MQLNLVVVFAALHAALYVVSPGFDWRNWGIYIEAIEGIILGPSMGLLAAFLGSSIARMIKPDVFWMFGIVAEPLSVFMVGLLSRGRWKPVLAVYAMMLLAYFAHPFGRALPIWTILDILVALALIYPTARFSGELFKTNVRRLSVVSVLASFVCVATDSLVRVFLLVPCGLYSLFDFFGSFDMLQGAFIAGAALSYVEDLRVVVVAFLVGVPLLLTVLKFGIVSKNQPD